MAYHKSDCLFYSPYDVGNGAIPNCIFNWDDKHKYDFDPDCQACQFYISEKEVRHIIKKMVLDREGLDDGEIAHG